MKIIHSKNPASPEKTTWKCKSILTTCNTAIYNRLFSDILPFIKRKLNKIYNSLVFFFAGGCYFEWFSEFNIYGFTPVQLSQSSEDFALSPEICFQCEGDNFYTGFLCQLDSE